MRIHIYEYASADPARFPASLCREGAAMLSALHADLPHAMKVSGPFSPAPDAAYLVIAPESAGILKSCAEAVLAVGGCWLGCAPSAIGLCADKLAQAEFWISRGIPHPRTERFEGDIARTRMPGPWVLKPRHGAGSQATFLIRNSGDEAAMAAPAFLGCPDGEFILQQFVPGQPASVALLISPKQTIPLPPARQHLSRDGRFHYLGGSLPLPERLATRAVNLALEAVAGIEGLAGYVGVDLTLGNDGRDTAIEINPRLTTSYLGLRQVCRENLAELMVRMAQGEIIEPPTWDLRAVQWDS